MMMMMMMMIRAMTLPPAVGHAVEDEDTSAHVTLWSRGGGVSMMMVMMIMWSVLILSPAKRQPSKTVIRAPTWPFEAGERGLG
jgi:hypothetical protein